MKRNQRWIILFAIVVLLYGIGQYWNQQRSSTIRAVLLDFLPRDVERIDIAKAQQDGFSILRQDQRWLITGPQISEEARPDAVIQLLKRLQAIRTEAIIAQSKKEWETYGVNEDQGVLVCLSYIDGEKDCVRIGRYAYASEEERLELYARLETQDEVYIVDGLPLSFIDGEAVFFRNRQLLALNQPLTQLAFQTTEQEILARSTSDSSWLVNEVELMEAAYWTSYTEQLQNLQGQLLVDDIDELSLDSMLVWQLKMYSMQDSFMVKCYSDSTKQPPFILHSTQFAKTWVSSDSAGLVDRLIAPWQKWLENE